MSHPFILRTLLTISLLFAGQLFSGEASQSFQESSDFTRLTSPAADMPELVLVFRYGSESSHRLYRILSERGYAVTLWPAVFRESWRPEAKLALMARKLEATPEQHITLFESVQNESVDWSQLTAYRQLLSQLQFQEAAIEPVLFDSELPKHLKQTQKRIQNFSISTVPTIIFKGQFTINAEQAKTPARLINILQYLEQLTQ